MGFILRMEGAALAALELEEAQASEKGGAAFEAFKETQETEAIQEAKDLGITESAASFTPSSSSSDDTSSDDDFSSGDDSFSWDDNSSDDDSPPEDESTEEEEDPEPEEEPSEEEADAALKKESFRSLSMLPNADPDMQLTFRREMFGMVSDASSAGFWGGVTFVASALATVGITYGPVLLMGMFKVVLFTFAKTFKVLDDAYDYMSGSIGRYLNRTDKQQASIKELKGALEELKSKSATLPEGLEKKLSTTFLEIGESNDYNKNVIDYTAFMGDRVTKLNEGLANDFASLKTIADSRYLGKNFDPLAFMAISPAKLGFMDSIESKPGMGVRVETYTMGRMIGNVELQADLCADRLDNWVSVEKAYNSANIKMISLGPRTKPESRLLSPEELSVFLNNLELLAKASLKHQKFYEEISKSRSGVVNSVKQLFIRIAEEQGKVSFKNSVALPLHLKSSFATKVYMTGAMDLHDHTAQVIANGLSYASSLLKLYEVKPLPGENLNEV